MFCSLSLYIQFHKKIKAQPTEIFSVSCAFFSFINYLFINDFCYSVANNYRLYFQNLFSYQSLICHCNALVLLSFIILPYQTSALLRILFEILRLFKYFLVNIINGYWWIVKLIKQQYQIHLQVCLDIITGRPIGIT